MKALVTGAAGFIGSHLVDALARRGHDVAAAVLPGEDTSNLEHLDVPRIELDLTWPYHRIEASVCGRGFDVVFHLAARAADWGAWRLFRDVNLFGTYKLACAAAGAGVKRFVFVSSLAALPFDDYRMATEDSVEPGNPGHNYGLSKFAAEQVVKLLSRKTGMEYVIVRPGFFPFGPRDRTSFLPLVNAMRRTRMPLVLGGRGVINTAYVENLCDGIALCGEKRSAKDQVFVIADDAPISWRELLETISKRACGVSCGPALPKPLSVAMAFVVELAWRLVKPNNPPPLTRYRALAAASSWHFKIDKARRLLGYEPKVSFDDGLERTIEWYRSAGRGE